MQTKELIEKIATYKAEGLDKPDKGFIEGQKKNNLKAVILHERKKGNTHLYKIAPRLLTRFLIRICKHAKRFEAANTFDEIMKIITDVIRKEYPIWKGIGELTTYDISVRIGAYKKKFPDKIYLHCGAKEGAWILLDRKRLGKFIIIKDLPISLQESGWNEDQIETFLCYLNKVSKRK